MIYSVSLTDPIRWLEKADRKSSVFSTSLHPADPDGFSEDLSIPNLRDHTFNFSKGLNVIVGPNGSGKSSLIRLLAKVFCCHGEMSSSYNTERIAKVYSEGIFSCCKVSANYAVSTFHYQPSDEVIEGSRGLSLANGINKVKTSCKSKGQASMITLESLLDYYRNDGRIFANGREQGLADFNRMVVSHAEYENKNHPSVTLDYVLRYYHDNHNDESKAVTFLLDSPDDRLDVPNQKLLYNLFLQSIVNPDKYQFIVSLNSLLLIQSLAKLNDVNWIDIEGDYLTKIVNIGTFLPRQNKDNKDASN